MSAHDTKQPKHITTAGKLLNNRPAALPQTAHIVGSGETSYIKEMSPKLVDSTGETSKFNWHIVPIRQKSASFPGSKLQVTMNKVYKESKL